MTKQQAFREGFRSGQKRAMAGKAAHVLSPGQVAILRPAIYNAGWGTTAAYIEGYADGYHNDRSRLDLISGK